MSGISRNAFVSQLDNSRTTIEGPVGMKCPIADAGIWHQPDTLSALARLMGQQSELLWSVAVGLIALESYICFRFSETTLSTLSRISMRVLLIFSLLSYLTSTITGYLSQGSAISMVINSTRSTGLSAHCLYDYAMSMALWQFLSLALGLFIFIVLCACFRLEVGNAIWGTKHDG